MALFELVKIAALAALAGMLADGIVSRRHALELAVLVLYLLLVRVTKPQQPGP